MSDFVGVSGNVWMLSWETILVLAMIGLIVFLIIYAMTILGGKNSI